MRYRCPHCDHTALVRNSEQLSPTVTYQYVFCTNLECGHTFRVEATAAMTISPSARPRSDVVIPLSPYVRRGALAAHLDKSPTGEIPAGTKLAGQTLQLDLIDDAPAYAPTG
jgi:hypothetical protein